MEVRDEANKQEVMKAMERMLNPPRIARNKAELHEKYNKIKVDNNIIAEKAFVHLLLINFIHGEDSLDDADRKYLYKFCIKALCELIQKGDIEAKWLLGNELIRPMSFKSDNLGENILMGNFLITVAAHEGHHKACDYVAKNYCSFGFHFTEIISNYWINKGQNSEWWKKTGESINLTLIEEGNIMYITIVN